MVRSRGSAFGAVVKNGSALKVLGQVQHIAYASRQALRHMGLAYDGQVLWKDGEGIPQNVVVAAKGPDELFGRALFRTQKAGPPGNAWGIGGGGRGADALRIQLEDKVFALSQVDASGHDLLQTFETLAGFGPLAELFL